jgi:conjugative transfer pilus assembly protein TraH
MTFFAQILDIVSMDFLVQYLRNSLERFRVPCTNLKNNVAYGHKIDEYLESLRYIETSIGHYDKRASNLMEQELYVLQKIELLEKQIASELCL